MTGLVMKLSEKVKREINVKDDGKENVKAKKKGNYYEINEQI